MSLTEELDATVAQVRAALPAPTFAAIVDSIDTLRQSGTAGQAASVGARPALASLPDVQGREVDLAALVARGPLVLVFYRGGWCPYCNVALRALAASLDEIRDLGAELVAVTPETPSHADETATRTGVTFPVLHDAGNAFARSLGLVFSLPEAVRPHLAGVGIDVPAHNGDSTFQLPIPATYVIARGGEVAYAFVDPDFTRRAEPADVIGALRQLVGSRA